MYARKKLQIVSVVETIGGERIFSLFECFANHLKSQGKNKMSFRVYQFKRRGASMLRVLSISSSVIPTTVEKAITLNNITVTEKTKEFVSDVGSVSAVARTLS